MTDLASRRPSHRTHRPLPATAAIALLTFLGVTAVPSGTLMLVYGTEMFPAAWVDDFPIIDSLVLPGLTLLVGFGLGSLLTAYGVWRRPVWPAFRGLERATGHHWSWLALLLLGLGHAVWIGLEYAYLGAGSFLQPTYGAVALLLVGLALTPAVRGWLRTP